MPDPLAYGNMLKSDPTQADLTSYVFVLCIETNVYLYNLWVEPMKNIHEGNG